jgi:hypothetical protein
MKYKNLYKIILRSFTKNIKPEEEVLLFTHQTAFKYYKLNVPFLTSYLAFSYFLISNKELPSHLRNTSIAFSSLITISLLAINFYANRHINLIKLKRNSGLLVIQTFSKFGFGTKKYIVSINDFKEMHSVSRYIRTKKTGIYILKLKESKKLFHFGNFFFIRPARNNPDFDRIFKKLLK